MSDDGWVMTDGVEEVMVVGHCGLGMLGGDTDGWTADVGRVITGGRRSTGGVRQVGQSDGNGGHWVSGGWMWRFVGELGGLGATGLLLPVILILGGGLLRSW